MWNKSAPQIKNKNLKRKCHNDFRQMKFIYDIVRINFKNNANFSILHTKIGPTRTSYFIWKHSTGNVEQIKTA